MTKEEAALELEKMLRNAEQGPYYTEEEVRGYFAELFTPENTVYLTGDTHGEFQRIEHFCEHQEVEQGSTFIILGDAGLNYFGDKRDLAGKRKLAELPANFFCIHGNHERRPAEGLGYQIQEYHGGHVWVEPQFPNIKFAIDGEIYDFMGYSCLVIGGAYSIDKHYRLARGFHWFPDEQPSTEIKQRVENVLQSRNWKVDVVFSHTCPLRYEPTEAFLPMIDQSTVDKSTEEWLGMIERKLDYERWYCGHYHISKKIDKLQFLFEDYVVLPRILSIEKQNVAFARIEREAEIIQALGLLDEDRPNLK